jgi:hypothetical protein
VRFRWPFRRTGEDTIIPRDVLDHINETFEYHELLQAAGTPEFDAKFEQALDRLPEPWRSEAKRVSRELRERGYPGPEEMP